MKIGNTSIRLKNAMSDAGLNSRELAKLSGVKESNISHYLTGRYAPSDQSADALSKVLGVSPAWLMGFDVPMHEEQYYTDDDTAREAQKAYEEYKILFDAVKDARPEDIKMVVDLLNRLKETNPDG